MTYLFGTSTKMRYVPWWELHSKDVIHARSLTIFAIVKTPTTFTPGLSSPDLGSSNGLFNSLGLSLFFVKWRNQVTQSLKFLSAKNPDPVVCTGIYGYRRKVIIWNIYSNMDPKTTAIPGFFVSVNGSINLKVHLFKTLKSFSAPH